MLIDNANIIRQKRKTLKITISDNGQLTIFTPLKLSYIKIEEILKSKEKLISKKINLKKIISDKNKDIISYKKILLLGKEYFIIPTDKVGKAYFTVDSFLIPQKYINSSKQAFFIKKTIREIASRVINNRVNEILQFHTQYKVKNVLIGNFKAKWGSCDNQGILKFNWKVIMLNPKLIDFIIYHELTHLKELNHSKNFYYNLERVFPEHKKYRAELKEFSFLLTIY